MPEEYKSLYKGVGGVALEVPEEYKSLYKRVGGGMCGT